MVHQIIRSETREMAKLYDLCRVSTAATCAHFFHKDFDREFLPSVHGPLFDPLDDDEAFKILVKASRGFGKSEIASKGWCARQILFMLKQYIILVAANKDPLAEEHSMNLRNALEYNDRVKKFLKFTYNLETIKGKPWSVDIWSTTTGTLVRAAGANEAIRGTKHGTVRPDAVVLDDIELPEEVVNEKIMRKRRKWLNHDVLKAFDLSDKSYRDGHRWKLVFIGTILGEDACLAHATDWADRDKGTKKRYRWHSVHIDICDDDCNTYYPELYTTQFLHDEREDARAAGELDFWYQERRNMIVPGEDAEFPKTLFQNNQYDEAVERLWMNNRVENILLWDPAHTSHKGSHDHAIMVIGFDPFRNLYFVRHMDSGIWTPDKAQDMMFDAAMTFRCRTVGIDINGPNDYLMHPLLNEMGRRGFNFEIVPLKNVGSKEERIKPLAQFYRRNQIKHNKDICAPLEAQLMMFPRPRKWHLMDCMAYMIQLFEKGGRFFRKEMAPDPRMAYMDDTEQDVLGRNRRDRIGQAIVGMD